MITFSDKEFLYENADIPEINKITDENINNIKAGINANESNIETLQTNLTNISTYSTTEINTGKIWINGKTIYRKTFIGDVSSSISHSLTNVTFVNSYGFMISSSGTFIPLPSVRPTNAGYYIGYYINATSINFDKANLVSGTATITVEYTKD